MSWTLCWFFLSNCNEWIFSSVAILRGTSLLCILICSAVADENIWRQGERKSDKESEILATFLEPPQATLLFWVPVAGMYMCSSTGCPPTSPRMLALPLSYSPYIPSSSFLCIASGQGLTALKHCPFSPCWNPFKLPPSISHLSLYRSPPHPVFRLYKASSTFFWWKLVM